MPAPIPARAWAALLVGSATVVLVILDAGFVALAFPEIERAFEETSRATLGWVLSGYFISLAAFMLVAGWVADRVGRRRVFFAGLGVFGLGAALTGISTTAWMLIASRVVQGAGAAALTPVSLAMVLPGFPPGRRATAVGAWAVAGSAAGVVSPTLGAVLVEAAGWRAPFVFLTPLCAFAWLVGRRVLPVDPEGRGPGDSRIDLVGIVATSSLVGAVALGVSRGDDWGWDSATTLAVLGLPLLVGPLLIVRARRRPDSFLDVELFAVRSYSTATIVSVLTQAGFFSFFFSLPLFLVDVWGWTILEAGMAMAVNQAAAAAVGLPSGRWADRNGHVGVVAAGGLLAAVGYGWLALTARSEVEVWVVLVPALLVGGVGSMMVGGTVSAAAFHDIDDESLGRAAGAYYVTRRLGSAVGAIAAVVILGDRIGGAAVPAFRWTWAFGAACYLAAAGAMGVGFRPAVTGSRSRAG